MYPRYKNLIISNDCTKLGKFIEESNKDQFCEMICARIGSPDAPKLLQKTLEICAELDSLHTIRLKLVESVLKTLRQAKVTTMYVTDCINNIVLDFPKYSKPHIVKLVEFCLSSIRGNNDDFRSWKDLLPSLLEIVEEQKYITHMGTEVSGPEYKSHIVKSIYNIHWDPQLLTPLAQMFRDISLTKQEHDIIIKALCSKMSCMPPTEIPPLVHQLLNLTNENDIRLLIETLRTYFINRYKEVETNESFDMIGIVSWKEVQEVESTVLYHIYHAVQLHRTMPIYLRTLKSITSVPEYVLEPFIMSVLLMTNVYEEQIFDILKTAISRKLQEEERFKSSAWLRTLSSSESKIIDVVDRILQNGKKDRELVLKGLVDFAFVLMSSNEKKFKDEENPQWVIGIGIIQRLTKKQPHTAETVLQMLNAKILEDVHVTQYIDCLSYMCSKLTMVIIDCQIWITTLVDHFMIIPGETATLILFAILPMLKISSPIRESLILILRKSLYGVGTCRRKMAVTGFLLLLKYLKHYSICSLSQTSNSKGSTTSSGSSILTQVVLENNSTQVASRTHFNRSICHDVLNVLKKCFTQEYEVRLHLYEGLYDSVKNYPEVSESVLQLIVHHFNIYYDKDENVLPPLKLDLCTDINGIEGKLKEPLAELIYVIQKLYIKLASNNSKFLDQLGMILESICKRMIKTELEHFNIDITSDLLDPNPKSQQKLQIIKSSIQIYEVLMIFRIATWSMDNENASHGVYSLFKKYKEFVDFTKRVKVSNKKGEGKNKKDQDTNNTTMKTKVNRTTALKLPNTVMDLNTIYKLISLLYEHSVSWANKEQANSLRGHLDFHHYVLQTCIQLLKHGNSLKGIELSRHKDINLELYLNIAKILYQNGVSNLDDLRQFDSQTAWLVMECFKELCEIICTSLSSELTKFLNVMIDSDQSQNNRNTNEQLEELINSLNISLKSSLNEEDDEYLKKLPIVVLETISFLINKMDLGAPHLEKIFENLKTFTEIENLSSAMIMKVFNLLLSIEEGHMTSVETLKDICCEISTKLGTIENDEESCDEKFKCLIDETILLQVFNIVNNYVKEKLNNVHWLLTRLKAECIVSSFLSDEDPDKESLKEKERSLCKNMANVTQLLLILTNIRISTGTSSDLIFKNLQTLYNLLSQLTKYFYAKSSAQNPAFQHVRFVQVVKLAGISLKSAFYNLVTYTEDNLNKVQSKTKSVQAQKNKVLRDTKLIPNIIYEVEQFNQNIILLGKKTETPIENFIKHSVNRDFRIYNNKIIEMFEERDVSMLYTQAPAQNPTRNDTSNTSDTSMDCSNEETLPKRKRSNNT